MPEIITLIYVIGMVWTAHRLEVRHPEMDHVTLGTRAVFWFLYLRRVN